MDRRSFLQTACLGTIGALVGNALLNLDDIQTIRASTRTSRTGQAKEIPLRLEDTPDLKPVGGAYHLEIEDLDKNVLVVHVSSEKYVAVDIKCTHKGCDVEYEKTSKSFSCPCHGSEFSLNGEVTKGPAKRPLTSYRVTANEEEVTIHFDEHSEAPAPSGQPIPPDSLKMTRDTMRVR